MHRWKERRDLGRGRLEHLLLGSGKRAKIGEHAEYDNKNSIGTEKREPEEVPSSPVRENGRERRDVPRTWAVTGTKTGGRSLLDTGLFWWGKRKLIVERAK